MMKRPDAMTAICRPAGYDFELALPGPCVLTVEQPQSADGRVSLTYECAGSTGPDAEKHFVTALEALGFRVNVDGWKRGGFAIKAAKADALVDITGFSYAPDMPLTVVMIFLRR
jgi:hypothetical protein